MIVLNHSLTKSVDEAFTYLVDMQRYRDVHPVVYKIDPMGNDEYFFYEKVKVLFFPVHTSYIAKIVRNDQNKTVKMTSRVQKYVYLNINFFLKSGKEKTEIREEIEIRAPFVAKQIFERLIAKTHLELFKNIEKN